MGCLRVAIRMGQELTTLMREPKFRITASASSIASASGPVTTATTCQQAWQTRVAYAGPSMLTHGRASPLQKQRKHVVGSLK